MVRLLRHWQKIEDIVEIRGPGPWFYAVHDLSVNEIAISIRHGT